jgi:predicted AlkP superfamily phosphohydrolase/phosphomutase
MNLMNPTLLIGLDGATFTILDALMENGTMPFLKEFVKSGTRAGLWSTPQPLTPPAWTSLMTGRSPGNHGVFDFFWAEERKSDVYFTLYNFRDIQCETIWSMVSRQNGRACSLNFPMMAPPPQISGYIVPGFVSWKHLGRNIHPKEFYAQLKQKPGFNVRDLAWDFDMEKKAEKGVPKEEYENWIEFHIRRERQWFEIIRYLLQHDPCELMAVLFDGLDKILHMGWRFLDPANFPAAPSAWERKLSALCSDYFRELDGFIAEIVALAAPETRIFMASDHGFGPSTLAFRVNAWLGSEGYLTWKNFDDLDEETAAKVRKVMDHLVLLEWDKTTAFARTSTSNGIYIRTAKEPQGSGVPADQYQSFRNELMEKLLAIVDPASGEPLIKQIFTKEEAFSGSQNGRAPDLTLIMRDHSFVSVKNRTPFIHHRSEVEGTHYPEGIFLARGPGIGRGATLPQLSILDVAPALLYSLGLDIPADLEGKVPTGVFEESLLHQRPPRKGASTQQVGVATPEMEKLPGQIEEEEEILKQLRALGYVE